MWSHQQEGVDYAENRRSCIFHVGMGGGKTRTALEALKKAGHKKVLVCCPKAVIEAWEKQAGLWAKEYDVLLLNKGTAKKKAEMLKSALGVHKGLIVVINYESAWRCDLIEKTPWDCLVYDEVHRLKSPSGKASRWAARMGKKNPETQRYGLSGTLLPNTILDAYGVYRAMESPECQTFGNSNTLFRRRYAIENPHVPGMVIDYANTEDFSKRIAETTFYRKSEDILDLPPIMHQEVIVPMTPAEARLYKEIESDCCAVLEEGQVTPQNVLVQLIRLLEVCGGYIHYDGEKNASEISSPCSKVNAISDLLLDLPKDEPVVVFCRFRAELAGIKKACEKMGRTTSELSGSMNQLADWQAGKTSVLVANTQSGGIGVDLTRAAYGVFYSLGHSLADYLQAIARLHRPGQEKRTHFYSLVSQAGEKNTVDHAVYDALRNKRKVIDDIIERRFFAR